MKFFSKFKKLNNRGGGIVAVIVTIALVSVLASIILCTSYMNYKMKVTNLKTKASFYTAETALDEIRVGLQEIVSVALSNAYLQVMENYSVYSVDDKNALLENLYYNHIYGELAADYTYSTFDLSKLTRYVTRTWDDATHTGCKVSCEGCVMKTYVKEGIILENVNVYYRDDKGYTTEITTDLRLVNPSIDFGAVTSIPDIIHYAVIADQTLDVVPSITDKTLITGNVYAAALNVNGVGGAGVAEFDCDDRMVIKNDINVKSTTVNFTNSGDVWARNLIPNSATVTVDNALILANDINIKGDGSSLALTNKLNAYGTSMTDASKSSAIVINGTNSELDFTGATNVTIAGHAFIGGKAINDSSKNSRAEDAYTGESISVKSNQLMYLVPGECVGVTVFTADDGAKSYGNSLYNRNPITYAEWNELKTGNYEMVVSNKVVETLGEDLSNYIDYEGPAGSRTPKYVTVVVPGKQLVYFYMTFQSEEASNEYFRKYYEKNSESINKYIKFYVDNMEMPDINNMVSLKLAGNSLFYDASEDEVIQQNATIRDASAKLSASDIIYTKEYDALCTKLLINYSDLSNAYTLDLSQNIVFDNIIDVDFMKTNIVTGGKMVFEGDDYVAVFVNNEGGTTYIHNGADDISGKPVSLIIATGNVEIQKDITGLVFADGNVTVKSDCKVTSDSDVVSKALWYYQDSSSLYVYSFFRDGSGIARTQGDALSSPQSLDLDNLVVYENWRRQ